MHHINEEEYHVLLASERLSVAQAAYDEAMMDYDPTSPGHEENAFEAMKAAIAAADAFARRHQP